MFSAKPSPINPFLLNPETTNLIISYLQSMQNKVNELTEENRRLTLEIANLKSEKKEDQNNKIQKLNSNTFFSPQEATNVEEVNKDKELIDALSKSDLDIYTIGRSLKNGANPNCKIPKINGTPLIFISMTSGSFLQDTKKSVELLIKYGADINAKDQDGMTALHYAAKNRNLDFAIWLIEHGADINAKDTRCGRTALHHAALNKRHDPDFIDLLLRYKADPLLEDDADQTPREALENTNQVFWAEPNVKPIIIDKLSAAEEACKSSNLLMNKHP